MSQNINIRLSSNVVQLSPGEGTVLAVTVINNGRGVERLELSVGNIDPGWLLFDQNELLLYPDAPGNEGTVNLQVSLPPTALPGSYSPTIEIRNAGEQVASATSQLVLVVNQLATVGPEFHLLQESIQTKHKWARFQLQVGNPLDLPQTLKLYGRPNLPSTRLRIIPPVVEVPPRGQSLSVIELEPAKRNRIRPGKRYDFMVGAENAPGQVNGFMIQTASLPFLARILASPFLLILSILLPLLIVAGVIAFILWPRTSTAPTAAQQVARCVTTNTAQTASLRMGAVNTDIYVTNADTATTRKVQQEPVERLPGIYSSLLSVSPDGKQLAYVTAANEALDDTVLWVVNLNSSAKQRIAGIPAGFWPTHPIWSQDASMLGYVVRNGSQLDFNTVNLTDKKTTTVPISQMSPDQFYGDPGVAGPLCFSTDNTRVVLASAGSSTQLEVNLADKTAKTVNKPLAAAAGQDKSFAANPANLTEPPLAPLPDSACAVKTFSQNDPLWRDLQMKGRSDNQNDTIGASGCALTSAAMMLNYFKVNTDPNELNACMGSDSNPINWNIPAAQCSDGTVAGAQRDYFSWDGLNESLNQGQPAVVGLLGGQTGTHFVVVLGGYDSIASTYRVNDPWDGTNNKSLAYFISRGYQLQWLVSFKGANPPVCKPRVGAISDTNPNFVLKQSSPEDGHAYNQPVNIVFTGGTERTTATLNQFASSPTTTSTTTTAVPAEQTGNQPGQSGTSQVVTNGQQVTGEGAYQLVIDSPGDNAINQRLTTNFVVDQTPPTLTRIPVGAFESNLSPDGAQIAHGNVTLQLKATDNLSGVAIIEYTVNGGAPQPYTNDVNPKPKIFTDAGTYDILYRATDGAGNVSQQQEWKFQIVLANTDVGVNGANTVAATPSPVATTPPANAASGGSGAAAGSGSDSAAGGAAAGGAAAGGAAGATTPAATTPAVTTPAGPPPLLVAAPNQLAFDATMDGTIVPINLTNAGTSPINFTVQPPAGAASAYLKFSALTGTVPAGAALPFQVQLASLNFTGQPVQGAFNVVYGGNTLQIPFTVAPQPNPTVAFTAPAAGPISNTVAVKLAVTTTGAGKPNHINLSAKYLDKIGGTAEERALAGQVNASNGWAYNWDVSGLPPQDGIEMFARLCWSADDSNCFKIDPGLTGLSIPKPTAAITLDPNNASLSGIVTLNAAVGGGPLDHITYSYTFKQNNADAGPITITEKATAANQFKVTWDTSSIPPQPTGSPVKLTALVCWTGQDNPATCTAPTSITPATLTVEPPAIVATALADADSKSLPLKVALGGTVSKLNNPGATVWVDYMVIQTFGQAAIKVEAPATLSAPTNGTAIWSANIDTTNLPPQTINFVPKVCWDGNKDGNYCYPVAVPLPGTIPPIVPAFVDPKPTDFSKPVNLVVAATPAGRASSVKIYLSYTRFTGQLVDYLPLTTEATSANNFTVPFDSVALGLAPNQAINFKLVACNTSGYCSDLASATPVPVQIPPSTLALAPTQDQLQPNPLPAQVAFTGSVTGRNVGDLQFIAAYTDSRFVTSGTYSKTTSVGAVQAGQPATTAPFPYNWDTTNIPPQSGINLAYKLCWNGTLDSGCTTPTVAYTNLTKAAPGIASVSINKGLNYNPAGDKILPIPYSNPYTNTVVTFPITAVVTDTKISSIKWQLQGITGQGNAGFTRDLANTSVSNGQAVSNISLNLSELITQTNANGPTTVPDFNLVGLPVWQGVYTITDTAKIKVEPIKFITFDVNMRGSNSTNIVAPTGAVTLNADDFKTATTMISTTTGISLTNFSTDGLVRRAYYNVSYNLGSTAPPNTAPQTNVSIATSGNTATPKVGLAASNFQLNWNHVTDLPKILPQAGVSLYWQLCNTDADDSGCLPVNISGSFNHVDNLALAGVRYDPDPLSNNTNVNQGILNFTNHYFNSAFDAHAKVVGGTAIKAVRYIAYPTGASPLITTAVVLNTRDVTTSSDGAWKSSVYWPSPDISPPQNQQAAALLNALSSNHLNMTLAIQMCSSATPDITNVADSSCSDWTGNTESSLDSTAKARVDGKLGIVVVWNAMKPCNDLTHGAKADPQCTAPDAPKDPYNQAIQDGPNANVVTRTVTISIYKVPNPINNPVNNSDFTTTSAVSIETQYIVGTTSTVFTGTDQVTPLTVGGTIPLYLLQRDWNVKNLTLPTDPDYPNQQRSVKLQVGVNFVIDSGTDPNITPGSYIAYATVPTKGKVETYNPPAVVGAVQQATATATPIPPTATPTMAPTASVAPTTAANSPTSVPTQGPTTAPNTATVPPSTPPAGLGKSPNPA